MIFKPEKQLIVVAGPNGAGKTTLINMFSKKFLAYDLGISIAPNPDDPHCKDLRALGKQRAMVQHVDACLSANKSVLFETTGASKLPVIKRMEQAKNQGFRIFFWFLWLPGHKEACERVKWRVVEGGHNVPYIDIRRRYQSGIQNLYDFIKNADRTMILNRSNKKEQRFIAYINNENSFLKIKDCKTWDILCSQNRHLKTFDSYGRTIYG